MHYIKLLTIACFLIHGLNNLCLSQTVDDVKRAININTSVKIGISLDNINGMLGDFTQLADYLSNLAANTKRQDIKPPTLNKIVGGETALKKIEAGQKNVENFSIPPETGPDAPPLPTLGSILSARKDEEIRSEVHKWVKATIYYKERYKQLLETQSQFQEQHKVSIAVRDAASKLSIAFQKLAVDMPIPAFYDTFGFAAAELEITFLPAINRFSAAIKSRSDELDQVGKVRSANLMNYAQNMRLLIEEEQRRLETRQSVLREKLAAIQSKQVIYNEKASKFEQQDLLPFKKRAEEYNRVGNALQEKAKSIREDRNRFRRQVAGMRTIPMDWWNQQDDALRARENGVEEEVSIHNQKAAGLKAAQVSLEKRAQPLKEEQRALLEDFKAWEVEVTKFQSSKEALSQDIHQALQRD